MKRKRLTMLLVAGLVILVVIVCVTFVGPYWSRYRQARPHVAALSELPFHPHVGTVKEPQLATLSDDGELLHVAGLGRD